jgi:hypothetical protein
MFGFFVPSSMNLRDLLNPTPPVRVAKRKDRFLGPVKVISDEGYLLIQCS